MRIWSKTSANSKKKQLKVVLYGLSAQTQEEELLSRGGMSRLRAGEISRAPFKPLRRELMRDCGGLELDPGTDGIVKAGGRELRISIPCIMGFLSIYDMCSYSNILGSVKHASATVYQIPYKPKPICYSYLLPNTASSRHVHVSGPEATKTESLFQRNGIIQ